MTGSSIWDGANVIPPSSLTALLLLQIIVIVSLARLLGFILQKINQPRVISEVIGGVLLGPSVLGRIPGFSSTLFPPESQRAMKAFSEFGLVLYLFLVGLELDPKLLKANMKQSVMISLAGIIVPFGVGAAVSLILYERLMPADTTTPFTSFFLFLGVAMSITAFPVLARILTETRLLQTRVGLATISAAAVDDFVAWCFLALVVAIINASNPLQALYTFLCVVVFALVMVFGVRKLLIRLIAWSSRSESLSEFVVFVTFLLIFASAFFTEVIGVHAIFGGFIVGVIMPHETGFAVRLTEKIEDLVTIILLPLYFASSGLKTELSLLDNGLIWGLTLLTIFVACCGKVIGCTLASRYTGLQWRDSLAVGILMNTKGLVELIVLNIGLDAGVINKSIFVVMVVMALVTTFMTTPLISYIYPFKRLQEEYEMKRLDTTEETQQRSTHDTSTSMRTLVCLTTMYSVPTLLNIIQATKAYEQHYPTSKIELHALRLMELTERTSAIMRAAESAETAKADPIVSIFHALGSMYKIKVQSYLSVTAMQNYGESVIHYSRDTHANMILLPWYKPTNNLDKLFELSHAGSRDYRVMISYVLNRAHANVAVLVDRGFGEQTYLTTDSETKAVVENPIVLVAFVGGEDDREALRFAARLCASSHYRICLLRVKYGSTETRVTDAIVSTLSPSNEAATGEKSRRKSFMNTLTAPITRKKSIAPRGSRADEDVNIGNPVETVPEDAVIQLSRTPTEVTLPAGIPPGTVNPNKSANLGEDEDALRNFREQADAIADHFVYEEWEHPEPLIFMQTRVANLNCNDLVVVGRSQPLLNLFSLASVPASLKNSEDNLTDTKAIEANVAENSKTTRSLLATFSIQSRGSAAYYGTNSATTGAGESSTGGMDDDRTLLGALAGTCVRKKCVCSVLVVQSHRSTDTFRNTDKV